MCLDHIIAHETHQFYLTLPLKIAPTCVHQKMWDI